MTPSPAGSARFALALDRLDGVGRVTVHRLLERFPTLDAVRATPREQVRLRLKGAPRADQTVAALFDDDAWASDAFAAADAEIAALAARGVRLLAPGDDGWPAGIDRLDRSERPPLLWVYGPPAALARPRLAILGRAPVEPEPFETAQALARRAVAAGAGVSVGLSDGFDVAVAKVAGAPVAVVASGLRHLAPSLRPTASAIVRAGGALVSPFPMDHGPFAHDATEAARVAAALARAVVASGVADDTPEARGAAWALAAGVPVAALPPVPPSLAKATATADEVIAALAP